MPEFLTISVSSFRGLMSASIVNVLSSNIINFIQYIWTVFLNKNQKILTNKAIKIDLFLIFITIALPILLIFFNIEINLGIIPIFIILYALFIYLNSNVHKLYLKKEDDILQEKIKKEQRWEKNNRRKTIKYVLYLLCTGVLLFIISELLGNTLEKLCNQFGIPQSFIGILLGFITSIPELITFFESQKHYKNRKDESILGVVEATNNLFTSNILNIFVIQSVGVVIYNMVS